MPQLIIALILIALAIVLAVMAIGVAIAAVPSWTAGTLMGSMALLLFYRAKIKALTSREKLGESVALSVNGSQLHWSLKESDDEKGKQIAREVVFSCLLGAATAGVVGYFIYQGVTPSDKPLFLVAIFVSALAVPWCITRLKPRNIYFRWLRNKMSRVIGDFDSTLRGMEDLRELQMSIGSLAEQLKIGFLADYVTEVEQHINSNQVELLFDRPAFIRFIEMRLQSAQTDLFELRRAVGIIQEMERQYLLTAREVNQTNSISLMTESDWLGAGLKPENLPTLLSGRKWDEFTRAAAMMKDEMSTLLERARKHGTQHTDRADTHASARRMTTTEALNILGLQEGATFAAIERARKDAVRKFNVDQRQNLEPHIRELVEERFKQVNMAFDLLKERFQTRR